MGFGPHCLADSEKLIHTCINEMGVVCFDTAPIYAFGGAEQLLGCCFSKYHRSSFLCATKGGLVYKGKHVYRDASPKSLEASLHESLERLKISYVDYYFLHWPDPNVNLLDSVAIIQSFKEQGLVKDWGVSNLSLKQLRYLEKYQLIPSFHQVHFSILYQESKKILAYASRLGMTNCVFSIFEQGLLLLNSSRRNLLGKKDKRRRNEYFSVDLAMKKVDSFLACCAKEDLDPALLLFAWVYFQPNIDKIILGMRRLDHLALLKNWFSFSNKLREAYFKKASLLMSQCFSYPMFSES